MDMPMIMVEMNEVQRVILDWIGSDEFNAAIENTVGAGNGDFISGAMWGAAMAGLVAGTNAHQIIFVKENKPMKGENENV